MTSPTGAASHYRPEIDGLRAIAVCAVILFHTNLGIAPGGFVGVDIFFVISGYLISSIILREVRQGKFTFAGFYDRRIRRIFPALCVVLLATTIGAWFILPPEHLQTYFQSLAATVAFASNIFFLMKSGYFGGEAEQFPLLHMWSLSVEEQYYLVFPIMVLILWRGRWLGLTTIGVLLVSLAACVAYTETKPMAAFYLTPMRGWELLAGVLISIHEVRWRRTINAIRGLSSGLEAVAAVAIIAPIILYNSATPFPGLAAVAPALGSALILLVSRSESLLGRALSSRPFVAIGLVSYSAYLWHQPLFALARVQGFAGAAWPAYAVLIVATFLLAWLSWLLVERPFRVKNRFTRPQVFGAFFLLSAILFAVGLAGHFAKGFPDRYDASTQALAATMEPSSERERCHTEGVDYLKPAQACDLFDLKAQWAVLGDSHSVELAQGLAEALRPSGQGVRLLSFSGCQPALTFQSENPGCTPWIREATGYLERSPEIANVLVVFRHSFYLFGDQKQAWPNLPDSGPNFLTKMPPDAARALYLASFTELVGRLSRAGKHVYLVRPFPELPTLVDRYIFSQHPGRPTGADLDYYQRRNALILKVFEDLDQLPNVDVLSPDLSLCNTQGCYAARDGKALYFDDNHLSLAGARQFIAEEQARGSLPLPRPPVGP